MGTRNNPGRYDCYAKAEDDEPLFTLLGRDPQGGNLVDMWGLLRAKDERGARRLFEKMLECAFATGPKPGDAMKIVEANHVAADMRDFRKARRENGQ